MLTLNLQSRELVLDGMGRRAWRASTHEREVAAHQAALVVCGVWDRHWSRGATERLDAMVPRMNEVVKASRDAGLLIVHAPSDTVDFYRESPARRRVLAAPQIHPPPDLPHDEPPLPVDASDGGSDTNFGDEVVNDRVWNRQHSGIEIDHERDAISDDGRELYNAYHEREIDDILIMGVHTNMCVLGRSFGIRQMVKWGFSVALVRDLTDAMYSPAMPPYVNHDEGTRLVVEYIEEFWCPTILSTDLCAKHVEQAAVADGEDAAVEPQR